MRRPPRTRRTAGCPRARCPKAFAYTRADDKAVKAGGTGQPEYKILVVAEKYQTGFDQPLLTTMYVNKTLTGIAAVQTLSRLNRTAERKSQADLAVLDFVNEAEDIQDAFRPYFEEANTLPSDPNLLYTAQSRVMSAPVISEQEMDEFAAAYFEAKEKAAGSQAKWEKLHAELYRLLSPAVDPLHRAHGERGGGRRRDRGGLPRQPQRLRPQVRLPRADRALPGRRAGTAAPLRALPPQPAAPPCRRRRGHRRSRPQPHAGGEDRRVRRVPQPRGPGRAEGLRGRCRAAPRRPRSHCCRS